MVYYILYPHSTVDDLVRDDHVLGEVVFETFWSSQGYDILVKAISNNDIAFLESIQIKNSQGKTLTIDAFLEKLRNLRIIG